MVECPECVSTNVETILDYRISCPGEEEYYNCFCNDCECEFNLYWERTVTVHKHGKEWEGDEEEE